MKTLRAFASFLLFALCLSLSSFSSAESSPIDYSPSVVAIQPGEACVKEPGELKCRWDGECAKVGNTCRSCTTGQRYSAEMDKCYTCSGGNAVVRNQNGQYVCPD
ncbi:hypothetical protein D3C84_525790 [compost metagenome]